MRGMAIRVLLGLAMLLPMGAQSAVKFIFPNLEMRPGEFFQLTLELPGLSLGVPALDTDIVAADAIVQAEESGQSLDRLGYAVDVLVGTWTGKREGSHLSGVVNFGNPATIGFVYIAHFSFGRMTSWYEFWPEEATRVFDPKFIRIVDPATEVPVSGTLGLLGASLVAVGVVRRRAK